MTRSPIRFDGRVAIVTGAGGGLGRSHALALAQRGATVVVNDLGGTVAGVVSGDAPGPTAAQRVVDEITAAGGRALASTHDIATPDGARALADAALGAFGRIDVLVNNAGILRDKSFARMPPADFEAVIRVHLLGSAWCTQAVWPAMQAQQYGRVVMTTSAAGLYGNFGQANYGAAKMGLVGLMTTLKEEGSRHGIRVNTIAPVALTRMTESVALGGMLAGATPEKVTAGVLFLASEACPESGCILSAGAGYFSLVRVVEGQGLHAQDDQVTPEFVAQAWPQLAQMAGARGFANATEALGAIFGPQR
ncbi:MAG TPA: SDR family NAD(P)-dependent oxidoreductase [Ramlibacter sp.]|nr:SDR family NAD(P)-dependent oxidoreductase [Ramlibacter sp.]